MPSQSHPPLTRRMFLLSSGTAVSVLALPKIMLGAAPVKPAVVALAFDGDAVLAAGSDPQR